MTIPEYISKKYLSLRPIVALSFLLAGIFAAKQLSLNLSSGQILIMAGVGIFFALKGNKLTKLFVISVLFFGAGFARGHLYQLKLSDYNQFYGQKVQISGKIVDDPIYREEKGDLEFNIEQVKISFDNPEDKPIKVVGKVRVRTLQMLSVHRGDEITASGKMTKPLGNRQGSISFANVSSITKHLILVERLRQLFFKAIYSNLAEPEASLGLGFLLGTRNSLPDEFNEKLNRTGLTHIVAVSGYNLTIIVEAVRRIMGKKSRKTVLLVSLGLIGTFMLFTGMAPSIARAAIVSVVSLIAWYFGKKVNPLTVILISAGITAYLNPLYIWLDLGWWLSVLAFAGVLIVGPLIGERYFPKLKDRLVPAMLLETFSAQIMTLPLILSVFGRLSIISIPANLVVVPFIPLAMLLIFLTGILGMLNVAIVKIFSLLTDAVMVPIVWAIEWLSLPAWAQTSLKFSTPDMMLAYLAILLWVMAMKAKARKGECECDFSRTKSTKLN
jgi:ComEC/Rec2-related protein